MTFPDVGLQTLVGYLLVTLRITAWLVIAPPFSYKAIPARVKALLGFAISLAVGSTMDFSTVSLDTGDLVVAATAQVAIGVALGFCCYLAFAAVEAAGGLIDLLGGFQLAQGYDPLMQSGAAVFGRLYQMTGIVLLFASDGYLVVFHGLVDSFDAVGVDGGLAMHVTAKVIAADVEQVMLSTLQIAGPLIAVLLLTDVGLGLLTRAAPALQAFSLGFPLKIFITLAVASVAVALLPSVVDGFADDANHQQVGVANASHRVHAVHPAASSASSLVAPAVSAP